MHDITEIMQELMGDRYNSEEDNKASETDSRKISKGLFALLTASKFMQCNIPFSFPLL